MRKERGVFLKQKKKKKKKKKELTQVSYASTSSLNTNESKNPLAVY